MSLKEEGDWEILQRYSDFEFDDFAPKSKARTEYENVLYLERPGCNLCMGNQEKAAKGDTVLATSTRLVPRPCCGRQQREEGREPFGIDPCCCACGDSGAHPDRGRI